MKKNFPDPGRPKFFFRPGPGALPGGPRGPKWAKTAHSGVGNVFKRSGVFKNIYSDYKYNIKSFCVAQDMPKTRFWAVFGPFCVRRAKGFGHFGLSGDHQRGLGGTLWLLMGVFYGFNGPKPTWDRMRRHWERPTNTFVHISVILGQKCIGIGLRAAK